MQSTRGTLVRQHMVQTDGKATFANCFRYRQWNAILRKQTGKCIHLLMYILDKELVQSKTCVRMKRLPSTPTLALGYKRHMMSNDII